MAETSSADRIGHLAKDHGVRVAVAESLTGGHLTAALAAGADAATWLEGGVVAYTPQVKFALLGVTPGPVNTARCAAEMAQGVLRVLGADVAVAATGVGGPGSDEGVPAGTVFIACADRDATVVDRELHLEGEPESVIEQTVAAAETLLLECLSLPPGQFATWSDCASASATPVEVRAG